MNVGGTRAPLRQHDVASYPGYAATRIAPFGTTVPPYPGLVTLVDDLEEAGGAGRSEGNHLGWLATGSGYPSSGDG